MRDSSTTSTGPRWRRLLFGLFVFLPVFTGCSLFHPAPIVPVLVRDAETKQPVTGAEVQLWSRADTSPGHVDPSGVTGADGMARVKADFPKDSDVTIHAAAPGYLADVMDLVLASKTQGAPAGGGVIEIYRGPRPLIELVVPTEVRGDVKVEVKVSDDDPSPPGQRVWRYSVPVVPVSAARLGEVPVVHVTGGPILEHGNRPEFRGFYPDGRPMPEKPEDGDIVLRWVRSEGADQYFVVGTKIDQESARRASEKNIGPPEKAKSSGGGGGGGKKGMGPSGPRSGGAGGGNVPQGW